MGRSTRRRQRLFSKLPVCIGLALLVAGVVGPTRAHAQDRPDVRVLTVVDYITGSEIYLASGTEHGLREGDTLPVYEGEGEGAGFLGTLALLSVTERRSVATFVGEPFPVERSDLMYLGIPTDLAEARAAEAGAEEEAELAAASAESNTPPDPGLEEKPPPPPDPGPPAQLHGRVSLDMDALQTTTRWGDDPSDEAKRTFSTPTLRLQARAQDLPGGMRLNTSMRLSHRTSPDDAIQPTTSLRFYQLDLEKRFEAAPVQLHLGRFYNPYDDFSGYWDGLMLHLGEGGLGAGVAVGYEPDLWNETVSTDLPKVSGFVDFNASGEKNEYSGAVSFSTTRPETDLPDRTYLGLSQRLRLGSAWIRNRVRVDQSPNGSNWALSRLQFDASVPLSGSLSAHGGWRRWRVSSLIFPIGEEGPLRDRANLGLSYWATGGGLSLDVSLDRPEVGEGSQTVSGSFFLRRTPLMGLGFSGMASYWSRGESTSLLLAPEVRRAFGRAEVRGGYRYYETYGGFGEIQHQSANLTLTLPLGAGVFARLQGFVQWGGDLTSNRILASLAKSF